MQGCRIGILECGRRGVQFRFPPILVNRQLEFLVQIIHTVMMALQTITVPTGLAIGNFLRLSLRTSDDLASSYWTALGLLILWLCGLLWGCREH